MKMTRRRALELCYRLWGWLAETGGEAKSGWPEWKFNGGKIEECICHCPCCEHARNSFFDGGAGCYKCGLKAFWHGDDERGQCEHDDSPFFKWDEARTQRTRKKYAAIIRDGAAAELKKYKGWKP